MIKKVGLYSLTLTVQQLPLLFLRSADCGTTFLDNYYLKTRDKTLKYDI